jgi:spore coat polysaccharide biosynthesis protein SpsF
MSRLRVVAIIQARMGSTRLPGKVLRDIRGASMLARVVNRARKSNLLDEILVATTTEPHDDSIVAACQFLGTPVFRGSQEDVLDRYYRAAVAYKAEAVVRITSDCPLIDSEIVDRVVRSFLEENPDYASNTLIRSYPRGLDAEVMTMAALTKAWGQSRELYHRVHVTPYIYQNPSLFRLLPVKGEEDFSDYRWTVDTPEDLGFIVAVYARLGDRENFTWGDVLRVLSREPGLVSLNNHVQQKALE